MVGGAVVAGGAVVGAGGAVVDGTVEGLPVGRGDRLAVGAALPGVAEVTCGRAGAVRAAGGAEGGIEVVGDAGGVDGGGFSSAVASTNGMTVSGLTGPPAKLIPTSTV